MGEKLILQVHVLSVLKCFIGILQKVFYVNVVKVDRDVAYVEMIVRVCCKLLFPNFNLFFPDVCCKRVYLDVAYVSHIR
jgi:hypothetical protein